MDIKQKAMEEMNSLKFAGDDDRDEKSEFLDDDITRSFRNSDFFESRPGEEDDDWPVFTGKSEVINKSTSHFSKEVLDAYTVTAYDQEKEWFTVQLRKKK